MRSLHARLAGEGAEPLLRRSRRNRTYGRRDRQRDRRIKPITLNLAFKNTDGGLKDIKLLRPGYDGDAQIFTSEFFDALQPFDAIRFMDYLRTNNSLDREMGRSLQSRPMRSTPSKAARTNRPIELGNRPARTSG